MRKALSIFPILLFPFLQSVAQQTVPLWPAGKVPNYKKTAETERRDTGQTIHVYTVQTPDIAVFLPPKRVATGQAVILCPGGGYGTLSYDWEGTEFAKLLNSRGIAAFVLKYRLPNSKSNVVPHQSPLMDAQRAIRLVRSQAGKWNIHKDKVGIMGFSAGGHLASTAGTHFTAGEAAAADSVDRLSSRPDFMVLVYPVITMTREYMHAGSRNNLIGATPDTALARFYSNDLQVTRETPPTFLVHATDDKAVPVENSLSFYQALKNNGVPAEMHIYPTGGHGFGLGLGRGYLETWTGRLLDWMLALNK
ncbi:alpha/beta hydrolase [Paraflavisolibacter sp. H34]|uniref:alpha/beta hydrolase n=1 Tax=Huijunlia imazamoxiresistens TaxID=3127457 RepID=UPI0030195D73